MTVTAVTTSHIVLDEHGRPWIEGTNTKVIEVVRDKLAHNWSPEQIHEEYPDLPLAKIHAAFAYYYDHQAEIDSEVRRQTQETDKLAAEAATNSPVRRKLRSLGKLP